jgi:hypothetical protein
MYRDPNGFRKLIVVLTAAGKALALHNGDGRVVWAARYDPAAPPTHLLRWRRFHDLTHAPQLALVRAGAAAGADAEVGRSYVSVLDGGSGRELERIDAGGAVEKVGGGFGGGVLLLIAVVGLAEEALGKLLALRPVSARRVAAQRSGVRSQRLWQYRTRLQPHANLRNACAYACAHHTHFGTRRHPKHPSRLTCTQ